MREFWVPTDAFECQIQYDEHGNGWLRWMVITLSAQMSRLGNLSFQLFSCLIKVLM
jgi:hypothetical protein